MAAFEKVLIRAINTLIVLSLAAMLVMVFGNVVLRYVFNSGISASEEASRILFVWMVFLGAIVAMRDHAHLGVDSFVLKLPPGEQKVVRVLVLLVMLYLCSLMLIGSWKQTVINLGTFAPVTGMSMAAFYATGLVGAVGMGGYILLDLWRTLSGRGAPGATVAGTADPTGTDVAGEPK
jgi:TRAP-type transport system small permease protein